MSYEKAIIRVPLDQYAYIEVEASGDETSLIEQYRSLLGAFKGGDGVSEKEMNMVVDKMMLGETVEGGIEIYEKMSDMQKFATQTLKRALKRVSKLNSNLLSDEEGDWRNEQGDN